MVLKPLNNDDIEYSGSDQWGFFGPFYDGGSTLSKNYVLISSICVFSS
jgi:hypothetical protein